MIMQKRITCLYLLLLAFPGAWVPAVSQEVHTHYLQIGELRDYSMYQTWCLFQDSKELIWIGTLGGMDCWDGTGLRSFTHESFDTTSFPAMGVYAFAEDQDHNLWLGTRHGGLLKFDYEKECFTRIHNPHMPGAHHVMVLSYDPEGFLWVCTSNRVFTYDPVRESFKVIPVREDSVELSSGELTVYGMECDTSGVMWFCARQGLYYHERGSGILRRQYFDNTGFSGDTLRDFRDMAMDNTGRSWIFQGCGELYLFNSRERSLEHVGPGKFEKGDDLGFGSVEVDREGYVWFGWFSGLIRYDPVCREFRDMGFPLTITDIKEGRNGNLMISTPYGVRILDRRSSMIRHYSSEFLSLFEGYITCLLRDDSTLWIGTSKQGIITVNTNTGQKKLYRAGDTPGSISSNYILKILQDRKGRIWIMSGEDLHLFHPERETFQRFDLCGCRYITMDQKGSIWLSGKDFLMEFDPDTFISRKYQLARPLPFDVQYDDFGFIRDTSGCFWMADRENGLVRINLESDQWISYHYNVHKEDGIPGDAVHRILYDSKCRIWIGTENGLSRVRPVPGTDLISCTNFFQKDGLVDNKICEIAEDLKGNLWVGTFEGISVLCTDGNIINFTEKDGLSLESIGVWVLSTDTSGSVLFGSRGISEVPGAFLDRNRQPPPLVFTGFSLFGQSIRPAEDAPLKKSIRYTDRIDLEHNENFFRFEFAALNYTHPERNQYRYCLEGVDGDTVEANHRNFAEYTNVPPGRYRFWVNGSNESGVWNPAGISILVRVHPPWYRTLVAFFVYIIAAILLVLGYIRYRISRYKREAAQLEEMVESRTHDLQEKNEQIMEMERMKTRFFTNISHEIRTPLTLIDGPLDSLLADEESGRKGREWLEMIKRNSQRLMQLVNQLLDISKLDAGRMKLVLSEIDVIRYTRSLAEEYTSLAETRGIRFMVDVRAEKHMNWIDTDKTTKVFSNLLSNAFKFTGAGGIVTARVKILETAGDMGGHLLRLLVADTGPGIALEEREKIFDRFYRAEGDTFRDAEGTGIGLSLTRELVHLMRGEMVVKSLVGTGTVFIVTLPMGRSHLLDKEYILKEIKEDEVSQISEKARVASRGGTPAEDLEILVVEDNRDLRTYITGNLSSQFSVNEAEDGVRGLKRAVEEVPDLVISDIMMPGMDGIELCAKLKNDERTSHIPVILLTAKSTSRDKILGYDTGADDYIFKPFRMEELRARIRNLLDQRERLRSKYSQYVDLGLKDMTVTTLDEQFLKKTVSLIEGHIHDFNLDVGFLMDNMAMSRSNLFRKLKALTGESPVSLIRIMRLKKAAAMIERSEESITDILMSVGFSSPSYFARCFRDYFGKTPTEYRHEIQT